MTGRSRGLDPDITRGIEPFPTAELTAYEPSYLSGFLAEENAVDLPEALESAKARMRARAAASAALKKPRNMPRSASRNSA